MILTGQDSWSRIAYALAYVPCELTWWTSKLIFSVYWHHELGGGPSKCVYVSWNLNVAIRLNIKSRSLELRHPSFATIFPIDQANQSPAEKNIDRFCVRQSFIAMVNEDDVFLKEKWVNPWERVG